MKKHTNKYLSLKEEVEVMSETIELQGSEIDSLRHEVRYYQNLLASLRRAYRHFETRPVDPFEDD